MQAGNSGNNVTKARSHLRSRPRIMLVILAGLVAGHGSFFYFLPRTTSWRARVSGVLVSGVVLLIVATHLGLFAATARPLRRLFGRRFGN